MTNKTYKPKANLIQLNHLHGAVAEALAKNLDDPKVLNSAIGFLKNNGISADIIESNEMKSLTASIHEIAMKESISKKEITVEDMLAIENI